MAVITELVTAFAVMYPFLAGPALAGSIADIEHVVLFMQGTNVLPIFWPSLTILREPCF
jgi:hypothetical protein